MDYEEALAIIEGITPPDANYAACIELCKHALGRQIAQKVIVTRQEKTNKPIQFNCPACNKSVLGSGFYCWHCGQHLRWEEE